MSEAFREQFDCLSDCAIWVDALWELMGQEWDQHGQSDEYDELEAWRDDLLAELSNVLEVE